MRYVAAIAVGSVSIVGVLGLGQPLPRGVAQLRGAGDLIKPAPGVAHPHTIRDGVVVALDARSVTVQSLSAQIVGSLPLPTVEDCIADFDARRTTYLGDPLRVIFPEQVIVCRKAVFYRDTAIITPVDGAGYAIGIRDRPRIRLNMSKSIMEGGVGFPHALAAGYKLSSVCINDYIRFDFEQESGKQVCSWIEIERRPHGRVPEANREPLFTAVKHHARMNAFQDWEERGVPLPTKYRPSFKRDIPQLPASNPGVPPIPPAVP